VTEKVWNHHFTAWGKKDLDNVILDYTEDSVVVVTGKAYRGTKDIRALFQHLFDVFDVATEAHFSPAFIDGKLIYITWDATLYGKSYPVGTDTFFIENGKILYQTVTNAPAFFEASKEKQMAPAKVRNK
jgi:ketosteroid isomerase-like protein